jgi:hypothetical protein
VGSLHALKGELQTKSMKLMIAITLAVFIVHNPALAVKKGSLVAR